MIRDSGYAVSLLRKQAIQVIDEYERIIKFLKDTNSFFQPGVLEVVTNTQTNEYFFSFKLDLACDLLTKEKK